MGSRRHSQKISRNVLKVGNCPTLMAVRKLTPLGDPASNALKWFAAVEIIRLAIDQEWLHKATKEISKH